MNYGQVKRIVNKKTERQCEIVLLLLLLLTMILLHKKHVPFYVVHRVCFNECSLKP